MVMRLVAALALVLALLPTPPVGTAVVVGAAEAAQSAEAAEAALDLDSSDAEADPAGAAGRQTVCSDPGRGGGIRSWQASRGDARDLATWMGRRPAEDTQGDSAAGPRGGRQRRGRGGRRGRAGGRVTGAVGSLGPRRISSTESGRGRGTSARALRRTEHAGVSSSRRRPTEV